ncbi:hypothetical protein ACU4GI_33390 [Cupriavidus basilensis]
MHHDSSVGYIFVIAGCVVGFFAGKGASAYDRGGMISFGGFMGLGAYLIFQRWGLLALIGTWLALSMAFWATDRGKKWLRRRRQNKRL